MDDLDFDEVGFLVGWCAACGREVLTHGEQGVNGAELRFCVGCDELVSGELRIAKGRDLADLGYAEIPASGCGSGGCGSGACGRR
jgi:hypothetical protein